MLLKTLDPGLKFYRDFIKILKLSSIGKIKMIKQTLTAWDETAEMEECALFLRSTKYV